MSAPRRWCGQLPDGYTLLQAGGQDAVNATLYQNLNFNFIRDMAPVIGIMRVPGALVVHPSVPVATVPEFIAYAKANPGKINFASSGNGSPQHIYGELFKMMAGVDMVRVPYRGLAPAPDRHDFALDFHRKRAIHGIIRGRSPCCLPPKAFHLA